MRAGRRSGSRGTRGPTQAADFAVKMLHHHRETTRASHPPSLGGARPGPAVDGREQILGRTSKAGQRDLRRILITGAMAVFRLAVRKGAPEGSWLARMLDCKPRMLVTIALVNKMARAIWAMATRGEDFRDPVAAG